LVVTWVLLFPCSPAFVRADWGPDVRLTYNDSASSLCSNSARCIVADITGRLHVFWSDYRDSGRCEVLYKRSTDWGSTWGPDVRMSLNDSGGSGNSKVDVDRQGRVHVVWTNGKGETIYKRSTDGGTTWDPDVRISDRPQKIIVQGIGLDALGWVHVVGMVYVGFRLQVWYRRSQDGGNSWDSTWVLLRDTLNQCNQVSMAVGQGQEIHIVTDQMHYLRSSDGGTIWARDTLLCLTPWAVIPDVSVDRADRVHIIWFDQRGGGDSLELFYKRSTDEGITWQPDFKLTHSDSTLADDEPVIAGDSTGRVHVLYKVPNHGIFYKRSNNAGITWDPPYHLIASGAQPHVVVDSRENAHVVYVDVPPGGSRGEIYYKRWQSSQGVEEFTISSSDSRPPFSVHPNPFASFATVPGQFSDRFALYDISGRKVGVYKGDRIGWDVSPGVYFLRAEKGDRRPVRIVKLR